MATHDPSTRYLPLEIRPAPYRPYEQTIGYRAHPDPSWNADQVAAWEAARALVDAWLAVGRAQYGPARIRGLSRRFARRDISAYLYATMRALETVIAPLFPDQTSDQTSDQSAEVCTHGTVTTPPNPNE